MESLAAMESVAVIWILAIGLVGMALLVCVLAGFVLQRNQRSADQKLVVMVQDLVNAVLVAKVQQGEAKWHRTTTVVPMTPEQREAAVGPDDTIEGPPDVDAVRVAEM